VNFAEWEDRNIAEHGEYDAIFVGGRTWTNVELAMRSRVVARALQDVGLEPGDRVLLLLPNCMEMLVASSAVWRAGGVVVVGFVGWPQSMIARIVDHCAPAAVIAPADVLKAGLAVKHRIVVGKSDDALSFDELMSGRSELGRAVARRPDDVAQIAYTSGSTGAPKAVVYTHGANDARLRCGGVDPATARRPGSIPVILEALPPSSFAARVARVRFAAKERFVLLDRFDAAAFLAAIPRHGVTGMSIVPSTAQAILWSPELGRHDYSTVSSVSLLGADVSATLVQALDAAFGVRPVVEYGMSEAGGPVTGGGAGGGRVGRSHEGVELRIVDRDLQPVAEGEPGEIQVKTPWSAAGNYREPEQTAATFNDGWVRSGDLGRIDRHGEVSLIGRAKDIIIQGGLNIYPQ
jgi:long-chain acyl-CoA synthetase